MHKIDGLDATADHRFQDENLSAGVAGTVLTAKILNAIQAEIIDGLIVRAGLTPSDTNNAQLLAAVQAIYGSGVAGGALKNRLINGDFQLWQRGLSKAIGNVTTYTADRWGCRADAEGAGTGTATLTRQDFAPGQTDVPGAQRYLRWVQGTGASSGQPSMGQRIEKIERFSGGQISVQFNAHVASGTLACALRVIQDFGVGGSAAVTVAVQAFTANTTWTKSSFTFTLPSIAGKTLGTNPHLRVSITTATGVTYTLEIADFQAELAAQPSSFDRRPLALELILASRYYQKSYTLDTTPGTDGGVPADARKGMNYALGQGTNEAGSTLTGAEFFPQLAARMLVPMRVTPTIAWYKPGAAGTAGKIAILDATLFDLTVSNTLGAADSSSGFPQVSTQSTGIAVSGFAGGHWTADAEL